MALNEQGKFVDKGRRAAPDSKDLQGAGALVLQILGVVAFLLAGVIALTASSLFVCVFFTGLMVTGVVLACTGKLLRR